MNTIRDSKEDKHNLLKSLDTKGFCVFMLLHDSIFDLLLKWERYKILFSSQEQIDLLNDTAPTFFYNIQRIMLDDIILHIARLTDKKEMGENENLSILWLPDLLDDDKRKKKIDGLCEVALKKTKNIRKVRNKIIVHTDKETALKVKAVLTLKKYVIQVDEAIDSICDPLNEVSICSNADSYCLSSTTGGWDASGGDVGSLIEVIKAGQKVLREK